MSGNAALAAARRRRNPVEVPEIPEKNRKQLYNNSMFDEEPILQTYLDNQNVNEHGVRVNRTSQAKNIHELVLEHDKLLFVLERKIDRLITESTGTDKTLGLEELDNYTRTTNTELKLLKTTMQKQQKSVQELTTLVTSLRATISNQNNTIDELTNQLNSSKMVEDVVDAKASSTVKIDITETQE